MTFQNYKSNFLVVCVKCQEIIQTEDKTRMNQVKQCLKNRNSEGFPVYGFSGSYNRHCRLDHGMTKQEIQEEKEARKHD